MLTAEVIAYHATERPEAIALAIGGRAITYAGFDRDIGRFARALASEGVARGSLVVVGTDDIHVHLLMLIALEALGAISASFLRHEEETYRTLLAKADLVVAGPHFPLGGARRHLAISGEWLRQTRMLAEANPPVRLPAGPGDPVRILRTSGTTGAMKMLALPRRQHEGRLQRYAAQYQFTETSRYLLTMPLTVGHIYGSAMACLRSGGRLVAEPPERMSPAMALAMHGITDVTLMPVQLKHVLDALPGDFPKPSRLTVCSFGAPISASLRQRTLKRLATAVYNDYGCNEAGLIFLTRSGDDSGTGSIWPGVEVEIVDEADRPVPIGETGRIRVRTEVMVEGYLDDPEATREKFKDGWFYPGDSGLLRSARRLQVLGRTDELLNIGGAKHAPADLEHFVASQTAVRDVGICSVCNTDGFEEICICVATDGVGDQRLGESVLAALQGIQLGHIHVVMLGAIPRNDAGKIQRDRLRRLAEDAVRGVAGRA